MAMHLYLDASLIFGQRNILRFCSTGEVGSIPLPHAVASIWSLPFGLLLQRATEGCLPTNISLSSSNPYLSARDAFRQKRDVGYSPLHNYTQTHKFEYNTRNDGISMSSHMILKHPFEEPQVLIEYFSLWILCFFHLMSIQFCMTLIIF